MESPETESVPDPTNAAERSESSPAPDGSEVGRAPADGSSTAPSAEAQSTNARPNRGGKDQGNERKGQRGRRPRRRGRRRRRPRDRDQDNRTEAELMAELPEDSGELMAMSRPLGLLEVLGSGSGFIRRRDSGYTPGNDDIYVGSRIIQQYGLRTGDELMGIVASQARSGKSPPL